MAMFTAYFDASGHPDDPNVQSLAVAGLLASAGQWSRFDRQWKKVLKKHGVSALHMKEFSHSRGEFTGWTTQQKTALLTPLVTILQKNMRHSFAMSISLIDYRKNEEKYHIRNIASPLAIAGQQAVGALRDFCKSMNQPLEQTLVCFEDGDADKANLDDWVAGLYGIKIRFESKRLIKAFEACDLLAYEHLQADKKLLNAPPKTFELGDLRIPFQRLETIEHVLGNRDHWGLVKNPKLESSTEKMLASTRRPQWPRV